MKRLAPALVMVSLASCGGGGGGGSEKDLFSLWHRADTNAPMDLTGGAFSTPIPFYVWFQNGAQCNCDMTIIGTQAAGNFVVNSCVYVYGSGPSDPGCNALNNTGTYTKSDDTLVITPSSGAPVTYN